MGPKVRGVEVQLARIAHDQHGVVTRKQLLRAGITTNELKRRLRTGALLPVHSGGVYRVGHQAPSLGARYMAAVLACGAGALLSGRAAAHLYCLVRGSAPSPEVTAITERRVAGVVTHRSRTEDGHDATAWHGIPVATVARTLVDLASLLSEDELARACHEAGVRYRTTPAQVEVVLARRPNSAGAGSCAGSFAATSGSRSAKLERRFLDQLTDAGLELPETNRPAGGRRVDCRWPAHRLTVELDSYQYHRSRHAWEQDRRREREARARGDEFASLHLRRRFRNPELMLANLRGLLTT